MHRYPLEAFAALDKLNSWVRSQGARSWWSGPRYAIYDWKLELIKDAIAGNDAALSSIYLTMTCRDCGGRKYYTDSSGYTWPHCRKCSSTGVNRLTFVVTDMHGFRWHTPWEKSWSLKLPSELHDKATLSVDWEPNATGKDMETWEVAACLNLLEPIMPKPGSHGSYCYGEFDREIQHSAYKLYLGQSERVCQLCWRVSASENDGIYHHVIRGNVDWTAWACDACKGLYAIAMQWSDEQHKYLPHGGNNRSIFDEFPVPKIEHPEIVKWCERRILPK